MIQYKLSSKINKLQSDLEEEKELNKALTSNQEIYQSKLINLEDTVKKNSKEKDGEIEELKSQLRDVMFYLDAQSKFAKSSDVSNEELQDSHLIIQQDEAAGSSKSASKSAENRRRKK